MPARQFWPFVVTTLCAVAFAAVGDTTPFAIFLSCAALILAASDPSPGRRR